MVREKRGPVLGTSVVFELEAHGVPSDHEGLGETPATSA